MQLTSRIWWMWRLVVMSRNTLLSPGSNVNILLLYIIMHLASFNKETKPSASYLIRLFLFSSFCFGCRHCFLVDWYSSLFMTLITEACALVFVFSCFFSSVKSSVKTREDYSCLSATIYSVYWSLHIMGAQMTAAFWWHCGIMSI